jgi:hypothetical protein
MKQRAVKRCHWEIMFTVKAVHASSPVTLSFPCLLLVSEVERTASSRLPQNVRYYCRIFIKIRTLLQISAELMNIKF